MVGRMSEQINMHTHLVGKTQSGKHRRSWDDAIKMDLKWILGLDSTGPEQDPIVDLGELDGNFFTSQLTIIFIKKDPTLYVYLVNSVSWCSPAFLSSRLKSMYIKPFQQVAGR
jgi:hypothetical protein